MQMSEITDLLGNDLSHVIGYPPTGQPLPYVALRPLLIDSPAETTAISGDSLVWDHSFTAYCCAGSAEASFNLAKLVMSRLSGQRVSGTTLRTTMGYSGAPVEGQYESQVTIQLDQGGL